MWILATLFFTAGLLQSIGALDQNSDIHLRTPDLVTKYGYPLETHRIVTDDGYILEMHRIPHGRNQEHRRHVKTHHQHPPILLQHGLAGSSADWVLTGPGRALAYLLADDGYDVWMGNNRGNIYSRQHRALLPTNSSFWDFSYHELGLYDLPAMIDHVLVATANNQLLYLGHSQGCTQFFVMTSLMPEYNAKITLAVGLAPAAFTGNLKGPVTQLTRLTYFGVWVGEKFGYPEFGSRSPWGKFVSNLFCHGGAPTQFICSNKLFLVAGFSQGELDMANLTVIIGHVPAGASWKQFVHFGQGYIHRGHFRAFDYGDTSDKNMRFYGSLTPPEYQLQRVTSPIAIFSSDNDWLATPQDVAILRSKLGNVILDHKVPPNTFNHYDFLWGNSARQLVFNPVLELLDNYR